MRDLLVTAIVFGLLPWAFYRPHIGLYLYSWLSYMNPHRLAYGFAFNFPFAYIVALTTIFGFLVSKEPKRMPWSREMTVLTLLVLWMLITSIFAFYPDLAWPQMEKVFKIQIMIFLTPLLINNRERLHYMIWVIALSLAFYGVKGGIFTIVHGGVYRVQGPDASFISGNNEMAFALVMTIPLLRYLHLQEKQFWIRIGLAAIMVLCGLAVIGSQSRGGLVAAAAMTLVLWFKSRHKFTTALLIGASIWLVVSIMPQAWYDRMHTIETYQEDASAQGRINAWWTAWNVVKERPFTGGGFETFQASTFKIYAPNPEDVHDVHSVYFEMLGEHGFVGLGLWLLLALLAWRTGSWAIRRAKRDPDKKWAQDLAAMTQVSMIGYASGGAFLGLAYFDLYYHLLITLVCLKLILLREDAERGVVEPSSRPGSRKAVRVFGLRRGPRSTAPTS
jgi:probable O-glycosylation ligase (exosortase A-associated)